MLISDVNSKLPYRLLKDVSVTKHKQKSDTNTVSIVLHDPLRWLFLKKTDVLCTVTGQLLLID